MDFFILLVIHPAIASLIDSRASSRVSPSDRHPGSSGHSMTKCPSSSFSQRIVSFMVVSQRINFCVLSSFQTNKPFCLKGKDLIAFICNKESGKRTCLLCNQDREGYQVSSGLSAGGGLCSLLTPSGRSGVNTRSSGTGRTHGRIITGTGRRSCRGGERSGL